MTDRSGDLTSEGMRKLVAELETALADHSDLKKRASMASSAECTARNRVNDLRKRIRDAAAVLGLEQR